MSYRKPLMGLVLFLVVSIVVSWMVIVTLDRQISGRTDTYSAIFTDVSGLHPGDDVRVAGVRVGRVDDVDVDGTLARVTFRVKKEQPLYTTTVASVSYQNIIGQRYLGLSPGKGDQKPLDPGAQIPKERTEPSFDVTYLLKGFEPLFTLLKPEQVDNLTTAIISALQGDSGSVLTLVTQTSALAEILAGPDQVLGDVITNLNEVVTNLAKQNADLQTVIRQTRDILAGLAARRDELRASVGSIAHTVSRLATITDTIYPDLYDFVVREPGFATHVVGDGRTRLAFLASNLPYVLKGVARFTQSGSYGDIYACDANAFIFAFLGRLIPSIVRHATDGRTIKHSAVCR